MTDSKAERFSGEFEVDCFAETAGLICCHLCAEIGLLGKFCPVEFLEPGTVEFWKVAGQEAGSMQLDSGHSEILRTRSWPLEI